MVSRRPTHALLQTQRSTLWYQASVLIRFSWLRTSQQADPSVVPTAYIYYVVSITGIGAGAHRLWSHRTYKARLPLRVFLIIANTMAFQVRSWCCSLLCLYPMADPGQSGEHWHPQRTTTFSVLPSAELFTTWDTSESLGRETRRK